jgi:hypothetical protein
MDLRVMLREIKDFGITQIKNVMLSVDKCVTLDPVHRGEVRKKDEMYGPGVVAHAHMCKDDIWKGYICIPSWCITNAEGNPSKILWHEYGHILDSFFIDCKEEQKKVSLMGENLFEMYWSEITHGESYKAVMKELGKPELAFPVINFALGE